MAEASSNRYSEYQDRWYGINGGAHPALIQQAEAADAENISFRGQKPHPRPAVYSRGTLPSGVYQGGCYYVYENQQVFVCSIGGRIYSVDINNSTSNYQDITPSSGANDASQKLVWFCQVDKYLVIQDGVRAPIVILGTSSKRADGNYPIPIGGPMGYVNGRLFVAVGPYVRVGDLIGSADDAVLQFSETTYLNEGGDFKAPAAMGNVVAISAQPAQDSATGQGPTLVWCENGVFSINSIIPRNQWKETQIQAITLLNIGATGHRSIINVNGDSWFRSHDGWRTYRQARAEISGYNQVPLSQPVSKYVDADQPRNLRYVSAVYWNNRLLMTSGPTVGNVSAFHQGVLSLDFDPVSQGFGADPQPAWDGIWTFGNYQVKELLAGVFSGQKRCFAVCGINTNTLVEFVENGKQDNGTTPIAAFLATRRYQFPQAGNGAVWMEKQLQGGDARVFDIEPNSSVAFDFKQDDNGQWKQWKTFDLSSPATNCTPGAGCVLACPPDYYHPRLKLSDPATGANIEVGNVDPVGKGRQNKQFIDLQLRIRWTGGWFTLGDVRPECYVKSDGSKNANPVN